MDPDQHPRKKYHKIVIKDLLFFDDLALYYLIQETPTEVLARSFFIMDPKLAISILKILPEKEKQILQYSISLENNSNPENNQKALDGLVLIAQNLYEKGMIIKKGPHFFGKEKSHPST